MKRLLSITLAFVGVVVLAGCGNSSDEGEPTGLKENPAMESSTEGATPTGGSSATTSETPQADN